MAIYAGESVRIYADADDWDGTPMSPADADLVTVTITNKYGETVETGVMTWNNDEGRWLYTWASPVEAGAYSIQVTLADADETSIGVRKVTLTSPSGSKSRDNLHFVRGID
jgi:hypothetical protein